jgi:AraC-like DNA-binding protein
MDYSLCILSVVVFIEKRVRDGMDLRLLERDTGFSYRHLREVFRECTRMTLARYALSRRVAHAAFDIMHTGKSLTDIAGEYGFETYDTFSRAFRRETGIVPSLFRKTNVTVGRKRLAAGAYGPALLPDGIGKPASKLPEAEKMTKEIEKTGDSCILYGVPKVEYKYDECTPFPSCLKACLNYMGQQADYSSLMAASGAAFRLRWNVNRWDGGNVDIQYVYEDPLEAFRRSFQAVGRKVRMLSRKGLSKEQFMAFIREEIDNGRPVIALGIIGPPEACILTGYACNGETLLGWNFFQGNPEFDRERETHECGYFITNKWWENECTSLLMAIGEEAGEPAPIRELLENAVDVLTKERIIICDADSSDKRVYAGGQAAFDAWAGAIGNDKEFPENAILPLLFERTMCQTDAQTMVGEGRSHASCWLQKMGDRYQEIRDLCQKAARQFREAAECTLEMHKIKGGFEQNEQNIRTLARPEVRKQIVTLINKAKHHDQEACGHIQTILEMLP